MTPITTKFGNDKTISRFWSMVNKTESCWLWTGGKMPNGYANFHIERNKSWRVHRFSYWLANGEIPPGKGVLHKCDVRHCVNPDHLFIGSQKDNLQDCKSKGRTTTGTRNAMARLDNESVLKIRSAVGSQRQIANMFNVHQSTVSNVINRKSWTHIS